jgi:hypothetical protein
MNFLKLLKGTTQEENVREQMMDWYYNKNKLTKKSERTTYDLAIWRGDEHILNFLFATTLKRMQTDLACCKD